MTLTKVFNAGIMAIKDQSYAQAFLYQLDINDHGKK